MSFSLCSLSEFLDLLKQYLPQNPIEAKYDDPVILVASCSLQNPSLVYGQGEGMVQEQVYWLVPGAGTHCVVQSKMALGRKVMEKEKPAQDKST